MIRDMVDWLCGNATEHNIDVWTPENVQMLVDEVRRRGGNPEQVELTGLPLSLLLELVDEWTTTAA